MFVLLVHFEPLYSLATAHKKIMTPYPPLFLMGNGFCQARCYLSLYYVRKGQRNDGFTSQPCYIVGKKKKRERKSSVGKDSEFTVCVCCFVYVCLCDTHSQDKRKIKRQCVIQILSSNTFTHTNGILHGTKMYDPERWKVAGFPTGTV